MEQGQRLVMDKRAVIARNLENVKARIRKAAERAGRLADAVRLVAVTKSVGIEEARILLELGQCDLAENRVTEGLLKAQALPAATWHLVGHLQTNKVNKVLGNFRWVHSLDSVRLVEFIGKRLTEPLDALVEVNVSGEAQKHGAPPDGAAELLEAAARFPLLQVHGLMTLAPLLPAAEARPFFRALRELQDDLNRRGRYPRLLAELSMGMSNDYEAAVEEGATLVRVGSALFEALDRRL